MHMVDALLFYHRAVRAVRFGLGDVLVCLAVAVADEVHVFQAVLLNRALEDLDGARHLHAATFSGTHKYII